MVYKLDMISVNEQLPDTSLDGYILLALVNNKITCVSYDVKKKKWYSWFENYEVEVTHWYRNIPM